MYESCFKLEARPFLPAPEVSRYFPAAAIETARQTLSRSIDRGEGPCLLIGQAGTGKSLLCHLLAHEFDDRFAVALLDSGRVATRAALLQTILHRLALPCRGMDEGELRLTLLDFLEPEREENEGLLLLVDEAHTLPLRLLEELRMITNLVRDGKPRVRVVLCGSPLLEERFASPKLSSFSQRLAARCYLEPLDGAETAAYVRAQIAVCGGDPARLLDDATLASVYRASDGIPRLINQVCDHALILASLGGADRLSSQAIEEAWADLQQLPPPQTITVQSGQKDSVVEFGRLDDPDDELPEAIPFHRGAQQPLGSTSSDEADEDRWPEADELPAGGLIAGTRIELEVADVFCEEFEEEEVVLDRYASDIEIFTGAPRVSGWETQPLSPIAESLDAISPRREHVQPQDVCCEPSGFEDEPTTISLPPLAAFAGGPIVCEPAREYPEAEAPQPAVPPVGLGGEPATPLAPETAQRAGEIEWAGAQVTSSGREVGTRGNASAAAEGGGQTKEYKQLFARMRRG